MEENRMKKIISMLLCVLMLASVLAPAAKAAEAKTVYPTIMVAGYSSCDLYIGDRKVWGLDTDNIIQYVLQNIAKFGRGLGELAFQRPEYFSDLLGQAMVDIVGDMACYPDGSSVYPVTTFSQDPEFTQYSYLYREYGGEHTHERDIMSIVARAYGSNGREQIFAYQQDFRMSMVECAATLDKYIDDVLAFTGAEKVNLFAVSHGGQTIAAYLYMYGREKNVINNIVLDVPAIGGAALAYDLMSETVVFDEETLLYFIENGQMMEEDINWLVKANQFGILDDVCNILMHKYVKQIIGYWGSIWDFIPADYYDELKDEMLDPVLNAELIEKSDYFHHVIYPGLTETFDACLDEGMNIYICAGCGMPSVTGLQEQSDAIIRVKDSTGSECAPYGSRFNDGYIQKGLVCSDKSHVHLSPDMAIDASTGFLPDQTWYINGMFHGMSWKDQYSIDLCVMLLFAEERVDVHTYSDYPQFKYSSNVNYSATAVLDHSPQGYWTGDDTALNVTNLSQKYKMQLISITVDGADATFDIKKTIYLEPQESVTIPMGGTIPEISLTTTDITINYSLIGSATPLGSRTLVFTLMNGEAVPYDIASPYAPAYQQTVFDNSTPGFMRDILKRLGFLELLKMLFNSMVTVLRTFRLQ